MTVKELIEKLKNKPQDAQVWLIVNNSDVDFTGDNIEVGWSSSECVVPIYGYLNR